MAKKTQGKGKEKKAYSKTCPKCQGVACDVRIVPFKGAHRMALFCEKCGEV